MFDDLDDMEGMLSTMKNNLNLTEPHYAQIKRKYLRVENIIEVPPPSAAIFQPAAVLQPAAPDFRQQSKL